jgi:spore maturation protein CgeB
VKPLSILYVGSTRGTSNDRAKALQRLGHEIEHVDFRRLLPSPKWVDRFTNYVGAQWTTPWLLRRIPGQLSGQHHDLCLVDSGVYVTPSIISLLRKYANKVINYNIDDPLGPRDGGRSTAYRKSVPFYDLCVVMRAQNVEEARAMGARDVLRVHMTADEVSHAPRELTPADFERWRADVLFLGTWFPERGPFLSSLIKRGVALTIRGSNWHKAEEWSQLKPFWKSGPIVGDDYAKAIQCAKVNLGLLSKGNRDLHTTRSQEIPALGGLLCAERTSEHLAMYEQGQEALFWDHADECAEMCRFAIGDEARRKAIASAGQRRVHANNHFNEATMSQIIARAGI